MLLRSVLYIIVVAFFAASIALTIIHRDILYILYPLLLILSAFFYPAYQLASRGISIKEFKEYILLFPLVQGLKTLFFSVGYILGTLKNLRN